MTLNHLCLYTVASLDVRTKDAGLQSDYPARDLRTEAGWSAQGRRRLLARTRRQRPVQAVWPIARRQITPSNRLAVRNRRSPRDEVL